MVARFRSLRQDRPRNAGGFTLLEIIIAAALTVTLLAGLWSLFHVYTRLFEVGQEKTERAQLVRALLDQMTDDLHSAIQDPVVPQGRRQAGQGLGAARRFGLIGASGAMRFDVLQIPPSQIAPRWIAEGEEESTRAAAANAPELRTVSYEFVDAETALESEDPSRYGLIRRDLDFETPLPENEAAPRNQVDSGGGEYDGESPFTAGLTSDAMMVVPEIVSAEFRYFDGRGWSSQWNSLQRKGLPVAVEVVLRMRSHDERPGPDREGLDLDEETEDFFETSEGELEPAGDLVYRLIIDLPGSPLHKPPKPAASTAMARLRQTRPAPSAAPRSSFSRPAAPSPASFLSDQWMRNQP